MTKPSDEKFHYVEGVFRFEKHAMVGVHRIAHCFCCQVEPPLPSAADVSAAIENGRHFVMAFGNEEGDYWPEGWIELRGEANHSVACPACAKRMIDSLKVSP